MATVGRLRAEPGAPNVIPGKVVLSLEIRDLSHEKVLAGFAAIQAQGKEIEKASGTKIQYTITNENMPALTDKRIQEQRNAFLKKMEGRIADPDILESYDARLVPAAINS